MSSIPANVPASIDALPTSVEELKAKGIRVLQNYINGQFIDAKDGKYIIDKNPATNEVIAYIPRSQKEDVEAAAKAAHDSFKTGVWSTKLSENERADILEKIANIIEKRLDEFALLESIDTGKPLELAKTLDIPRAISNFRFFASAIRNDHTSFHNTGNKAINYTLRKPIGVCGLITPWNLPLYLLSWKVAPALAVGDHIVAKPSELTPLTAYALAQVIHEVGLPAGVFNMVHGYGRECGNPIVEHKQIKLISFTGGTATGRIVGAVASSNFKKLSLELGGKNPMLVFDDCDFDDAVATAKRAGFANQGEICLCCSRLFVQEGIYDKFVAEYVKQVQSIKVGDPLQKDTNMGALISNEHLAKIEYYLELAKQEGGQILCGGKKPANLPENLSNGAFIEPAVIAGLDPYTSRVVNEEIFGPVVTIHKFKTEAEAIELANSVNYGLCASVFTNNLGIAHRVADKVETGMVWTNCWLLRDLRVPFGGAKESGVGREGGAYSLEFYTEDKNVCIKL